MTVLIQVDLREEFAPIRDQGPRPTCLAFAMSAAHERQKQLQEHLSTEYLFYHAVKRSHGDPQRGLPVDAACTALQLDGQPEEQAWPYINSRTLPTQWVAPTGLALLRATPNRASFNTPTAIRHTLSNKQAIVLSIMLTLAFYTPDRNGIIVEREDDCETGCHAVVATGYGLGPTGPLIMVRNSWGSSWGRGGYAWVPEAYLMRQLRSAFTIT